MKAMISQHKKIPFQHLISEIPPTTGLSMYKWVVPSEDPAGNLPTGIIWTGAQGVEYTTDQLLDLVKQMRLGRAADLYGNISASATTVQPAQGTDLGENGDEAKEEDDGDEEEQGRSRGRDPAWC